MRKLIGILALLCVITPVFADDGDDIDIDVDEEVTEVFVGTVAARMSCDDMVAEINKLNTQEEFTEADEARLEQLMIQHRAACVKKAGNRRASGGPRASATVQFVSADEVDDVVATTDETVELAAADVAVTAGKRTSARTSRRMLPKKPAPVVVDDTASTPAEEPVAEPVAPTPEEIAANIEAGLCADGTKPNKFGCCTGETFKDLGNLQFACCPADGGDCFPPMNEGRALL